MEEKTPQASEVSVNDYLDILRRRKGIIIQTFLLIVMVGTVVTFLAKPVYRTTARILVEGRTVTVAGVNTDNPLSGLTQPDNGHDVNTQIEILQGDEVVKRTFAESGVPPGGAALQVKEVGLTDVLEIIVDSGNAGYAYNFAKQLPETYESFLTGNRKSELEKSFAFAKAQLKNEQAKLADAQRDLRASRAKSGIYSVGSRRSTDLAEQGAAEAALQTAQTQYVSAKTKLAELQKAYTATTAMLSSATVTSNPEISALKLRIADLKTQRASLIVLFKATHPKVMQLDTEISDLEHRLATTPANVAVNTQAPNSAKQLLHQQIVETSAAVASAGAEAKQAQLRVDQASKRLLTLGSNEPIQETLEGEVDSAKTQIAAFTKTTNDLEIRLKAFHKPVSIIAPPGPAQQVEPKKLINIAFSVIIGLLLGFGLALLMEFLDDRVNSTDEAYRIIGVPTLGYIPIITDPDARLSSSRSAKNVTSVGSAVLESYRLLRTNLQFSNVDRPIASLMVTSALPGEGKSITAVNLATAFAMAGRRVILVDADLRRPSLHTKLSLAKHPGLTSVLLGTSTIEESLQETGINNLHVMTSGLLPPNPAELFGSNAMLSMHDDLQAYADIVIWDTPPVLAAADAQVLSANVDGVLFVLQHGTTRKSALRHATQVLRQARANILGIVFNRVDPAGKRDDHYYSYYQYYQSYTAEGPEKLAKLETRRQFEALVANGSMGGPKNGSGNGADHSSDELDDLDGQGEASAELVTAGAPGSESLPSSAVVSSPPAGKTTSKLQNPMERTVVLPVRSPSTGKETGEDKQG